MHVTQSIRGLLLACSATAAISTPAAAISNMFDLLHPPKGFVAPRHHAPKQKFHSSISGTWTDFNGFQGKDGASVELLLTDGTAVVDDWCTNQFYRLTPDNKGKYETGTWAAIAPMPSGYYPNGFASEILPDGRMIINGGLWSYQNANCGTSDNTNKGALYNPVTNKWTRVQPPTYWSTIGETASAILTNGQYMLSDCCSTQEALAGIKGVKVTWTATGTGKLDSGSEGWYLLPDGTVLTVDTSQNGNPNNYEIYDLATFNWSNPGTTYSSLVDSSGHMGPAVMTPQGKLIVFGGTGNNNLYDPTKGVWTKAPSFPVIDSLQYDSASGVAAPLPDGHVLVMASPGDYSPPSHFFEYWIDAKGLQHLEQVDDSGNSANDPCAWGNMLNLPTGQILFNGYAEMATYTPQGTPNAAWLPVISSVASTLKLGSPRNAFSGTNFNGFSQGATKGTEQSNSNYPLVRITNNATQDVCFGRSYNFSTMGVWTSGTTNAEFSIPSSCETGASTLQVIVNGLASKGVAVTLD